MSESYEPIIAGKRKRGEPKTPTPSESVEQQCLFQWAEYISGRYPEIRLLYHIPNGGSRTKTEAARFKAEGVKAGIPDLGLPVARGGYHGAYIEMKKQGGIISAAQEKWLHELAKQGYFVAVCYSWEAAAEIIEKYLSGGYENESETKA